MMDKEGNLVNLLRFDSRARDIIAARLHKCADAALCLELRRSSGPGAVYALPSLNWTTAAKAARQDRLLRASGPHGVPIFVAPRLWRYLTWHPIAITGQTFGPFFTRLLPAVDPLFAQTLRTWEYQHPDIVLPRNVA